MNLNSPELNLGGFDQALCLDLIEPTFLVDGDDRGRLVPQLTGHQTHAQGLHTHIGQVFRVIKPTPRAYTHTQVRQHADILRRMDEGTLKTQTPKCRLYWCLIDFDPSCELLPLLSDLPHPSPSSQSKRTVHTDSVWLGGGGGGLGTGVFIVPSSMPRGMSGVEKCSLSNNLLECKLDEILREKLSAPWTKYL